MHQLDDVLGRVLAAELVDAGLDGLGIAFGHAQMLHAPGRGVQNLEQAERFVGLGDHPVRADHAVEAIFTAQQIGDDLPIVGHAHVLGGLVHGDAVVGHDLLDAGLECRLEGRQVVVEVVAGVDLLLAVGEVGIETVLLRTAAGEVLDHAGHALGTDGLALEAADVGGGHACGKIGLFAEGAGDARPARLGGQVGHGMERAADADGPIFLAGDVAEALDQIDVARGRHTQRIGPLGEAGHAHARARVVLGAVARVRTERHRDAQPRALGHGLQLVVPGGHFLWILGKDDVEMYDVAIDRPSPTC